MTNNIITLNNQLQQNNTLSAVSYQPAVAGTYGYDNFNGVAPGAVIQKPVNMAVYGTKYRAILAAEGWAVVDNYQKECMLRTNYLTTILELGVFDSKEQAIWFAFQNAIGYAARMLGDEFVNYFTWPAEIKLNTVIPFSAKMVEKIAAKRLDYYDKTGLPKLTAITNVEAV